MKSFAKFLVMGAALAAPVAAFADQISVAGGNSYTSSTITFTGPYLTTGDTGIFSVLNGGSVTFTSGALNYAASGTYAATDIFTVTNGSNSVTFYATGDNYVLTPYAVDSNSSDPPQPAGTCTANATTVCDISLTLNGMGYFMGNYFSGLIPASFNLTSQGESAPNGSSSQVSFSATAVANTAVTPEPSSLVLLGTGLIGAAGLLCTRRRSATAGLF